MAILAQGIIPSSLDFPYLGVVNSTFLEKRMKIGKRIVIHVRKYSHCFHQLVAQGLAEVVVVIFVCQVNLEREKEGRFVKRFCFLQMMIDCWFCNISITANSEKT